MTKFRLIKKYTSYNETINYISIIGGNIMKYVLVMYLLIGAICACINGITMTFEKRKKDKDYEDWIKIEKIDESRFYEKHCPSPYTSKMIMLIAISSIALWPIMVSCTLYYWFLEKRCN